MTVGEFKQYLHNFHVPNDAEILIFTNKASQDKEVTTSALNLTRCEDLTENIIWEGDYKLKDIYSLEELKNYDKRGKVTAICIYE